MLVFVAGGSGAIGRPLVSRLARAGHNVVATTRAAEQAQLIRDAGAEPVVVDAFDTDALPPGDCVRQARRRSARDDGAGEVGG